MTLEYSETELEMISLLEQHVNAELEGDLDLTMATMTEDPYLLNRVHSKTQKPTICIAIRD